MNYHRIVISTAVLSSFLFASCKKDQSTIHGVVQYQGLLGTNVAEGAQVYLYENSASGAPGAPYEQQVIADNNGNFTFDDVPDGTYVLYGQTDIAGVTLEGTSSQITVEKDDDKTVNLLLD